MENATKGNYWTFLIFEDNIEKNPNWLEKLIETHIRFCVSPYHDHDTWSELDIDKHPDRAAKGDITIGEKKKAHYHVMMHMDANSTFKTVKEITEELGLPVPQVVRAPYGMYRYFIHQDNPEKYQYNTNDIKHYNGSEPADYLMEISKQDKVNMHKRVKEALVENRIIKYKDACTLIQVIFDDRTYYEMCLTSVGIKILSELMKDNRTELFKEDSDMQHNQAILLYDLNKK